MENKINKKLPETGQGNYSVEKPKTTDQNPASLPEEDAVGAPPLVIVVQGGRGVNKN